MRWRSGVGFPAPLALLALSALSALSIWTATATGCRSPRDGNRGHADPVGEAAAPPAPVPTLVSTLENTLEDGPVRHKMAEVARPQGPAGHDASGGRDVQAGQDAGMDDATQASTSEGGAGGHARETLEVEEGEADPRSEMVTIKVVVDPPKRAHVFWGIKDLGVAPLEIRRPRGSGPVDLVVRCPGTLTVHTRAFTDRDDKISMRMVPEAEGPRVFGYRPSESKPKSTKATTNPAGNNTGNKTGDKTGDKTGETIGGRH